MNKTVGVFFGSRSPEHDISIITGELIISELKKMGYSVAPVFIGKAGEWYIDESLGMLKSFTLDEARLSIPNKGFDKYYLDLELSRSKLVFRRKNSFGKKYTVDIAFPALHGSYGEDGSIQGLFEMLNVPYVGCDVPSSAIAMDKVLTKYLYNAFNIPTTKFITLNKLDWDNKKQEIKEKIKKELTWPIFVKPARLGSSIGIAKVKDRESNDLEFNIEVALHYDNKIIVEEAVENLMDVTCCILGNNKPVASLLQEATFSSDLFDFDEKYLKEGGSQFGASQSGVVIPARINGAVTEEIRNMALRIFDLFDCSGIARVDFLYNKVSGQYFANEINTLPGTLYHHLWKASGMDLNEVIGKLLLLAQEKNEQKKLQQYSFSSNLLKQTGSIKLDNKKL